MLNRFHTQATSIFVFLLTGITILTTENHFARAFVREQAMSTPPAATIKATPILDTEDSANTKDAFTSTALTTELLHGVDISAYTKAVPIDSWKLMKQDGWDFAIASAWQGRRSNKYAAQQLSGARTAGLKTAAYCLLNFDNPKQTGDWQVRQGLAAIGSEPVSFLAIDVEVPGPGFGFTVNATKRIQEAIQATLKAGLKPVIYTKRSDWKRITKSKEEPNGTEQFKDIPLWGLCWDEYPDLHTDQFAPATLFGGWSKRIGKQYADDRKLWTREIQYRYRMGAIDLNVFEAEPFTSTNIAQLPKAEPASPAQKTAAPPAKSETAICF